MTLLSLILGESYTNKQITLPGVKSFQEESKDIFDKLANAKDAVNLKAFCIYDKTLNEALFWDETGNLVETSFEAIGENTTKSKFVYLIDTMIGYSGVYEETEFSLKYTDLFTGLLPLNTEERLKHFYDFVINILNVNYHPDDDFSEYLDSNGCITDKYGDVVKIEPADVNLIDHWLDGAMQRMDEDKFYEIGLEVITEKNEKDGIFVPVEANPELNSIHFQMTETDKWEIFRKVATSILMPEYCDYSYKEYEQLQYALDGYYKDKYREILKEDDLEEEYEMFLNNQINYFIKILPNYQANNIVITKKLRELSQNFYNSFAQLSFAWLNLSAEDNIGEMLQVQYPFQVSFEELKIKEWVKSFNYDFVDYTPINALGIYDCLKFFYDSMFNLNEYWEEFQGKYPTKVYDKFNEFLQKEYPFLNSFGDVLFDVSNWYNAVHSISSVRIEYEDWKSRYKFILENTGDYAEYIKQLENCESNIIGFKGKVKDSTFIEQIEKRILIKKYIKKESWFELDEENSESINFRTRQNGNVGDETPGRADITEANRVCQYLRKEVPGITANYDTVDEWTDITVTIVY